MQRYDSSIIKETRRLRGLGRTYGEIIKSIHLHIPKSTLSEWCKNTQLPPDYVERIAKLNSSNLHKGRIIGWEINKIKRKKYLKEINDLNFPIAKDIEDKNTAKIALAMLCLGEASKSTSRTSFYFGNSDQRIIVLFLGLMKYCYKFDINKIRCTVQCRADQEAGELERYWQDITKIPKELFYPTRVDPRTIGKITKKKDYKGVLRVDYFDNRVRLDLESLASLIYNHLSIDGPVA